MIINSEFKESEIVVSKAQDSTASIKLISQEPNELVYKSKSSKEEFAVFSEMYYENGWNAYVDGIETPHYNVNYVLRGMQIPAGEHTITFKFEPQVIKTGSSIALASSILLGLLTFGGIYFSFRKKD